MKTILHLTLSPELSASAREVIADQKKSAQISLEVIQLKEINAEEVLRKIFTADSVCVWPATGAETNPK